MEKNNYTIENVYEPGYASFKPNEDSPYLGKQGFIPTNQLGLNTDPRTANQIAALSQSLNQGVSILEIGNISPQVFETIPKQHFAEMRRKAKLAGAKVTLHSPIQGTDPAGFGERGYEESNRESVERQLKDVVDKAILIDDKGNLPITIHGSNAAGSTFKYVENKKTGERKKMTDMLIAVDRETGQLIPIKEDVKFYAQPELNEKTGEVLKLGINETYTPEKQLGMQNSTKWIDDLQKVEFEREKAEKALMNVSPVIQMEILNNSLTQNTPEIENAKKDMYFAEEHLQEASRVAQAEFSRAYKIAKEAGDEEQMKKLNEISEEYIKNLKIVKGKKVPLESHLPFVKSQALGKLIEDLRRKIKTPEQFVSIEDFSIQKASDTFSNVAMHSYDKKGEKAPVLSIENLYQGMGFSQGKDLKLLVEKSREKFINKLVKEKGVSKSYANKIAEKLIGVTFDVGHLNVSRKMGFNEKELVKEAKEVSKFVNKVHLTDNFGFSDSHLPPGMGNVPFQALLEALGEKGAKAIKINEVGGWFEHFKSSPFPQILEAYGSPIYSSGTGPYWSQTGGFQQSYMEGYGQMLPQINYQTFGAGFSQLPQNLGGSQGQQGSGRMGGGGF